MSLMAQSVILLPRSEWSFSEASGHGQASHSDCVFCRSDSRFSDFPEWFVKRVYLTFFVTQSSITLAISRLFFSIITM